MDDTPENRETMWQEMLAYDEPYLQPGMKRDGMPFYLGVTMRSAKIAVMTGADAKDSFKFVIGQWTPWSGLKRVDLPIHEIRWVSHV